MPYEMDEMGKATDKPKGFVRWSLIAYWTAILGLCTFIAKQQLEHGKSISECNADKVKILKETQSSIDMIRVEYNNKLEQRINRLENVEERIDKALPNN